MTSTKTKLLRLGVIAAEFGWTIVAAAIVGHYADLYFGTDPWLTLGMTLIAVFGGFYRMIVWMGRIQRDS